MKRQTAFSEDGLDEMEAGLTREDQTLKRQMRSKKALCPYCLYFGTLWDFHTRLKNKRGKHFISISKCKCPDCHQGYMKKTLVKISNMTMEEYSNWFWSQMFEGWGFGDHIDFNIYKPRLKKHFSYKKRQIFWDVYWEYKDASPGGEEAREEQGAYDDYLQTMKKQAKEDYEDYKKAYEENDTPPK